MSEELWHALLCARRLRIAASSPEARQPLLLAEDGSLVVHRHDALSRA